MDGGFGVSINIESLQMKLGLERMEPSPFQVKIAYQR